METEPEIGALLPCNVVVREEESGKVRIDMMDPNAVLKMVENPEVGNLAADVRARLERALAAI